MKKDKTLRENNRYATEKVLVTIYASAEMLKCEIRRRIKNRHECGWRFITMTAQGGSLILCFKNVAALRLCAKFKEMRQTV